MITRTTYRILMDNTEDGLVAQVNDCLSRGWLLHGSLTVHVIDGVAGFWQAMTKATEIPL